MFEVLRDWLNSRDKNYYKGVLIFSQLSNDAALVQLFQKSKTDYKEKRLLKELNKLYEALKPMHVKNLVLQKIETIEKPVEVETPANVELYNTCRSEALKVYKQAMNLRARLFALATVEEFEDPNLPGSVEVRSKLAVEVVLQFNRASALFDRADFVKQHGYLPNVESEEKTNYEALPDYLVKSTLDNLRKNLSKLKHKEQTPERVAKMQEINQQIQNLLVRWHSLQPKIK